jgi:uncharacterized protein (TIGR03437 family)
LASIFCAGLSGFSGVVQSAGNPLPRELAGVQVRIHGIPAPLFSISDLGGFHQINLQVPFEAGAPGEPLDIEISQNGVTAWVPRAETRSTAPGIFSLDGAHAAIQHGADFSLVTPESPAERGEIVVLYGTGLGSVSPPVASGMAAPGLVSASIRVPTVTVGGESAEVLFSGLVAGLIGVYQINLRVPQTVVSGDQDVVISFPPYQTCCLGGTLAPYTVRVDSKPVRLPVR